MKELRAEVAALKDTEKAAPAATVSSLPPKSCEQRHGCRVHSPASIAWQDSWGRPR